MSYETMSFTTKEDCVKPGRAMFEKKLPGKRLDLFFPNISCDRYMGQEVFVTDNPEDDFFLKAFLGCPNQSYMRFQKDTYQLRNYEAEKKVYRCLQKLNSKILTVAHRFECFVDHEIIKSAKKKQERSFKKALLSLEEKISFVVQRANDIAIIEVKNDLPQTFNEIFLEKDDV